jgi:hypothetical protein
MVRPRQRTTEQIQEMLLSTVDTQIKILQESVEANVLPREKARDVIDCLLDVRSASSRLGQTRRRQKAAA